MPGPIDLTTLSNVSEGQPDHAGIHNAERAALRELSYENMRTFDVMSYGADPTGVADSTAAFASAASAMMSLAKVGRIFIPAGVFRVTSLPTLTPPAVGGPLPYCIQGVGSSISVIMHYGTSAAASLTVQQPNFDAGNASFGAPTWRGFTIDGSNSSGGCSGIRWGDISYWSADDIEIKSFGSGDGMLFFNNYGWCEGVSLNGVRLTGNQNAIRFDVGSGKMLGTVSTTIAANTATTSIPVSGLTSALYAGQNLVLATDISTPGVAVRTVVVSAAVAAGATSIPVNSFTSGNTYTAGTARVYFGAYGSFDYWTVNQLYIYAGANQNGIVSEASRGLSTNIERVGSSWRVTGNLGKGATNTGSFLWIKGKDNWDWIDWDVSVEVGGTGIAHKGIRIDSTDGYVGGQGRFIMYYCSPSTFAGGTYQFNFFGRVALAGVVDTDGSQAAYMLRPFYRNVAGNVQPSSGLQTAAWTRGTIYQNTSGQDVFVTIPVTLVNSGSASWNVDNFSSVGANTNNSIAAPSGGFTFPMTFVWYNKSYARIDTSSATDVQLGTPKYRFV